LVLINEDQAVVVWALAPLSDDFNGEADLFHCREDIDSTGLHCRAGAVGVATLLFFYGTGSAKITRSGTEAEGLEAAEKENLPLQLSHYRLYIGLRLTMEQYRSAIRIEDFTHLLRCRRKWRTNEALAETVASELTLQANPGGGFYLRRRDYAGVYYAGFFLYKFEKLSVR
jgi:hypothetical protein